MWKKKLVFLIAGAFFLFVGLAYNLYTTAINNSEEGKILVSKNYKYQGTSFDNSILIYTGSTLLLSWSGEILSSKNPIVLDVQYSSWASTTHRKVAISSGYIVTERPDFFRVYLGSGATMEDVLTNDWKLGLFREIENTDLSNQSGSKITNFETKTEFASKNETQNSEKNFTSNKSDEQKVETNWQNEITKQVLTNLHGASSKEENIPEKEITNEKIIETISSDLPKVENAEIERWWEEFISKSWTEDETKKEEEKDLQKGLLWDQYPDTDEGNYQLSLDKTDANYCKRINDLELRESCNQTIYESLGRCDLLKNELRQQTCKNMNLKNNAVAGERLTWCTLIQNDSDLVNQCIDEINQKFYKTALEKKEVKICNAIYNATMQAECVAKIEKGE